MRQKRTTKVLYLLALFLLAACAPAAAEPTQALPTSAPSETAEPTATLEPTPTSSERVIYDFQELHCQATWTNNGQNLVCPSNIYEDHLGGSVSLANESSMEGTQLIGEAALMTRPAHDFSFRGIFGAYPPIIIQGGDEFRAKIGCMDHSETGCDVEFSLEYYDSTGNYVDSQITGWYWNETNDGVTQDIVVDLSPLAGETVRLVLVVRDNGDATGDYPLWLHPRLWRTR